MTIETIRSDNGRMYNIEYEGYLSPEQRSQIMNQLGCSTCRSSIVGLAPTCTATSKVVGQIVTQRAAPTGQGPFTVIFKKDGVQLGTTQTVPTAGAITNDYTIVAADTTTGTPIGTHTFSVETTGSCAGSAPCIESCSVATLAPVLTTITIPAASVAVMNTVTMTATCKDQVGIAMTCPLLSWTSSNTAVASVVAGRVVGITIGTATITATAGTVSGSAIVTVGAQVLGSITLAPISPTVNVGSTVSLTATCKDAALITMTCPALTWTSSNGLVATVSTTGVVTGVAIGTATITATSGTISDSEIVTVTCVPTSCGYSVT